MEASVFDSTGKDTSRKVNLPESIFGIENPNDHVIYLDVKRYLANQRQGTHKAKPRAEIVGSTKKLRKQKGNGAARVGSIKSPIFRGGGRIFGPEPRDYTQKLNKKVKVLARKSALSLKYKSDSVLIVEDFDFEKPKSKDYLKFLTSFSLQDKKTLAIIPNSNKNVYLSSRNLSSSKAIIASKLNTYDILNVDKVIFFESSLSVVEETLDKKDK